MSLFLLLLFTDLDGSDREEGGTLIVSYQTGPKGERLERVRFCLKQGTSEQKLYPKKGGCVDDSTHHKRMVVVENLPQGTYTLEFLVPNTDSLFEIPSPRAVQIEPGSVVHVEELIKPRYGSIRTHLTFLREEGDPEALPEITLFKGDRTLIARSRGKKQAVSDLTPGPYTLIFEEIEGFQTPEPLLIQMHPGENLGPFIINYKKQAPAAQSQVLSDPVEEADAPVEKEEPFKSHQIEAKVILPPSEWALNEIPLISLHDWNDHEVAHSHEGLLSARHLKPGTYTLKFHSSAHYQAPSSKKVYLHSWKEMEPILAEYTLASGTLVVAYDTGPTGEHVEKVCFRLNDSQGISHLFPRGDRLIKDPLTQGYLVVEQLPVGTYTLEFFLTDMGKTLEPLSVKTIKIQPNRTTTLQQTLIPESLNVGTLGNSSTTHLWLADIPSMPHPTQAPPLTFPNIPSTLYRDPPGNRPEPNGDNRQFYQDPQYLETTHITIDNTLPTSHWSLYRGDLLVESGMGAAPSLEVPIGGPYRIEARPVQGYSLNISPEGPYHLNAETPFTLQLDYRRDYGYVDLSSILPEGEIVKVTLEPRDSRSPIELHLKSIRGKVYWKSGPVPTGNYKVSYELSPKYFSPDGEELIVTKGNHTLLHPQFVSPKTLRVKTNSKEAQFVLRDEVNNSQWQGEGEEFTFNWLLPGNYTLTFTSKNPTLRGPPQQKINLKYLDSKSIEAHYQSNRAGV